MPRVCGCACRKAAGDADDLRDMSSARERAPPPCWRPATQLLPRHHNRDLWRASRWVPLPVLAVVRQLLCIYVLVCAYFMRETYRIRGSLISCYWIYLGVWGWLTVCLHMTLAAANTWRSLFAQWQRRSGASLAQDAALRCCRRVAAPDDFERNRCRLSSPTGSDLLDKLHVRAPGVAPRAHAGAHAPSRRSVVAV